LQDQAQIGANVRFIIHDQNPLGEVRGHVSQLMPKTDTWQAVIGKIYPIPSSLPAGKDVPIDAPGASA
jgi:hypothetical protein